MNMNRQSALRQQRWGDKKVTAPAAPAHDHAAVAVAEFQTQSTFETAVISDQVALQALLTSAEARQREKQQQQKQEHQSRANHDSSSSRRHRPYASQDRSQQLQQQQQSTSDTKRFGMRDCQDRSLYGGQDNDYYGPAKTKPHRVRSESDDDDDGAVDCRYRNNGKKRKQSSLEYDKVRGGDGDERVNDDASNIDTPSTVPVQKPDFGLSGALHSLVRSKGNAVVAAASETAATAHATTQPRLYKGIVLKFQEPPEARAPNTPWRLYVFKKSNNSSSNTASATANKADGGDLIETLHIAKQSAYLLGRLADVVDIVLLHPSCSSQHAVLQYRAVPRSTTDGAQQQQQARMHVQPYIMDLESTNGTFLNGIRIESARYYELRKGDILQFGSSTREYVLLTAHATSL